MKTQRALEAIKMKKAYAILAISSATMLSIAGCATTVGDVVTLGPNSYTVGVGGHSQHTHGELTQFAVQRASDFCGKTGKVAKVNDVTTSGARGITVMESDIAFQCFNKNDPQYVRSDLPKITP